MSDERNKDLSKWLRFSCEYRGRAEGSAGGGLKPNNDAAYILSRLRLNMTIEPQRWLKL